MNPPESDAELATRSRSEAGKLLVALREQLVKGAAPTWIVMDEGDAASQSFLAKELRAAPTRRRRALRGEGSRIHDGSPAIGCGSSTRSTAPANTESPAAPTGPSTWRLGSRRVQGGAVSLPPLGVTLSTDPPPDVPMVKRSRPVVVTSRSRSSFVTAVAAEAIDADVLPLGSAGAKAMAVVTGLADVYVHAGGMYQWDSAAPAAVALAAGLHVSRIDGSPVVYNDPDRGCPTSSCAERPSPSRSSQPSTRRGRTGNEARDTDGPGGRRPG